MDAINILLVEDNPGDVRLVQEALAEQATDTHLLVARDGVEALEYLQTPKHDTPLPSFILLDINLPRKNGHEVLSEIKSDPALKQIPVIVLSSSKAEDDIMRAYDSSANCYVVKPLDLDQFLDTVRRVISYWHDLVSLPSKRGGSQNSVSY
jgi:two-component system, chemotaxis family, response regulator Rcp1